MKDDKEHDGTPSDLERTDGQPVKTSQSPGAQFLIGFFEPFLKQLGMTLEEVLEATAERESNKPEGPPSELFTRLLLGHEFPELIEEMDRRIGEEIDTQFKEAAAKATCYEDIEAIDIDLDEIRGRHEIWLKEEIARRMQALLERVSEEG